MMALALMLTGAAFFLPSIPLWCAGLPLLLAIMARAFTTRFVLALSFFFWPALTATLGLTALGYPTLPVSFGTALAVLVLPLLMAWLGIVPVSLALLLLPTFPANPLLVLIDALPGSPSLITLILPLLWLLIVEALNPPFLRAFLTLLFCAGLGAGHLGAAFSSDQTETRPAPAIWVEQPVPVAITERGSWVRLRDSLAPGSEAILGENLFTEDDVEALAFWRKAARDRNLTLWIGVKARDGRGMLLHLAPDTVSIDPEPAAAARYGIPGITGTWRQMDPRPTAPGDGADTTTATAAPQKHTNPDWLFCYEALLPHAWMPLRRANQQAAPQTPRPIVVLASDRWLTPLPFHVTRRKVARAMADMAGREVYFAETGRTILLRSTQGDSP